MSEELTKTELGLEVPVKPGEGWRKHTAERWKRDDLVSYEMCIELIRGGEVNQSELARLVAENRAERGLSEGVSRNSIHALMMSSEFAPGEIDQIAQRAASVLRLQTLGKSIEMVDKVKSTKDLGALAMVATMGHNVAQTMGGKPTAISERRDKFSFEDFEAAKERARKKSLEGAIEAELLPVAVPLTIAKGGEAALTMVDGGLPEPERAGVPALHDVDAGN